MRKLLTILIVALAATSCSVEHFESNEGKDWQRAEIPGGYCPHPQIWVWVRPKKGWQCRTLVMYE